MFIFSFADLNRFDIELHVYSHYTAGLSILGDTIISIYVYYTKNR